MVFRLGCHSPLPRFIYLLIYFFEEKNCFFKLESISRDFEATWRLSDSN